MKRYRIRIIEQEKEKCKCFLKKNKKILRILRIETFGYDSLSSKV